MSELMPISRQKFSPSFERLLRFVVQEVTGLGESIPTADYLPFHFERPLDLTGDDRHSRIFIGLSDEHETYPLDAVDLSGELVTLRGIGHVNVYEAGRDTYGYNSLTLEGFVVRHGEPNRVLSDVEVQPLVDLLRVQ